jgi:hypothetical protein
VKGKTLFDCHITNAPYALMLELMRVPYVF